MKSLREQIKDVVYHDTDVEEILEIISQEVSEAIPKEDKRKMSGKKFDEYQIGIRDGYNNALFGFQYALKKKGLI